jgi:tRNA (guanine9-N1)-methyltransferase
MNDKDIGKCVKQLLRIYTANRRATNPIPLFFTGIKKNGKIQKTIEKNDGYENWKVTSTHESFLDVIKDKEKIVYLSSDSDNVLEKIENDHYYVIGGLVDHNHNKGLCFSKANQLGIKHARLPLSEHILIKTRTVLTINQVYEIILKFGSEGKNWTESLLEVIPTRKGAKPLNNDNEENDEEFEKNEDQDVSMKSEEEIKEEKV